jgi:hypothetical protein
MKWVTREDANVDRIACPWLIKRFIDPDAEFLFVARDQVLATAEREGGHSYDAQGAEYRHRDGKCSFDVFVEEFKLTDDPGLVRLAGIVHAADVSEIPLPEASPSKRCMRVANHLDGDSGRAAHARYRTRTTRSHLGSRRDTRPPTPRGVNQLGHRAPVP